MRKVVKNVMKALKYKGLKVMQLEKHRRITVSFPEGHPVWQEPQGKRSARIREWVDLAVGIKNVLEDMDQRLEAIESGLARRPGAATEKEVDLESFLSAFD